MSITARLGGPVIYEARIGWDAGDQWGTTMQWLFAISEVLYVTDEQVPAEWEFRPGMGLTRESLEDDYPASILLELLDSDSIDADDLRYAGKVLNRYENQLRLAGQDY